MVDQPFHQSICLLVFAKRLARSGARTCSCVQQLGRGVIPASCHGSCWHTPCRDGKGLVGGDVRGPEDPLPFVHVRACSSLPGPTIGHSFSSNPPRTTPIIPSGEDQGPMNYRETVFPRPQTAYSTPNTRPIRPHRHGQYFRRRMATYRDESSRIYRLPVSSYEDHSRTRLLG
jgi:hypothetical protein